MYGFVRQSFSGAKPLYCNELCTFSKGYTKIWIMLVLSTWDIRNINCTSKWSSYIENNVNISAHSTVFLRKIPLISFLKNISNDCRNKSQSAFCIYRSALSFPSNSHTLKLHPSVFSFFFYFYFYYHHVWNRFRFE